MIDTARCAAFDCGELLDLTDPDTVELDGLPAHRDCRDRLQPDTPGDLEADPRRTAVVALVVLVVVYVLAASCGVFDTPDTLPNLETP